MAFEVEFLHELLDGPGHVLACEVNEAVSDVFDIHLVFLAPFADLDLNHWLWTSGTLVIGDPVLRLDDVRRFEGVVEEMTYLEPVGDAFAYRLRLRPLLHGLAYRVRSRIFQNKSVIEISKQVLKDAGIPDAHVVWPKGTYGKREYCVQWKESELDFLRRLWEDEGIFFWYAWAAAGEDEPGKHLLHLADAQEDFKPIDGVAALEVTRRPTSEMAQDWIFGARLRASHSHDAFLGRTWDYQAPSEPRAFKAPADGERTFERYEYPFGLTTQKSGDQRAGRRLELLRARRMVLTATSSCLRLGAARTFTLVGGSLNGMPDEYVVTRARHVFRAASEGGGAYRVELEALPAATPFRPRLVTRKPRATTTESAVVVGPAGEEIHVDAHGRVKIHFYWDREGKIDDHASCWVRVQQQNTTGSLIIPRIGWEVEVGFIDADPDQPIVLQKLYNRETMPPYGLPASLHMSALQSSSSPGGGGTNEIRMSDSSGGMEFFVHAQKDFQLMSGGNFDEKVGVNSHFEVKVDANQTIVGTETVTVGANQSVSVTGAATLETVGAKTVSVSATDDLGVKALATVATTGARTETIGGLMNVLASRVADAYDANHTRTVGAALALNAVGPIVDGSKSKIETIGGAKVEIIAGAKQETIGAAKALTAGKVTLTAGGAMGITGKAALAITVGGPVSIKADGDIALDGNEVRVTVGKADFKAGATLKATPGTLKIKASKISTGGQQVKLKGTIEYK